MTGLLASPPCAVALFDAGSAVFKQYGKPNTWTPYLHEWADFLISADSDNFVMQELHTPNAVAAGLRVDAIQAVCDGREQELTADESEIVEFIRNVVQGTMTNASWESMQKRIGSERGIVEYVWFILVLVLHIRLFQVFDAPGMSKEEHYELLDKIREGSHPLPDLDQYHARRLSVVPK
jgi:hypothetical protein